jgi:hypothetical protein
LRIACEGKHLNYLGCFLYNWCAAAVVGILSRRFLLCRRRVIRRHEPLLFQNGGGGSSRLLRLVLLNLMLLCVLAQLEEGGREEFRISATSCAITSIVSFGICGFLLLILRKIPYLYCLFFHNMILLSFGRNCVINSPLLQKFRTGRIPYCLFTLPFKGYNDNCQKFF